ncbi:MAG: hypothetical protein ABIO55_13005 [Ginsengibacter sp.]
MTLYEYNHLDQAEQFEVLYKSGVHISDRADSDYCIILFQLDSFYVELYFHIERNTLKKLRSFSNVDFIKPYLEQIDLSELFIETLK